MNTIWPIPKIEFRPLSEIEETRPVALVTSGPAWKAVENQLHLPVVWRADVTEATIAAWDQITADFRGEVVYSVGGGLPADAGKYIALKQGVPLVGVPTALSVDAPVTWASGIREGGCVRYIETKIPDLLVVDLDVIAAAPASIRAAGICDVLSIATGKWDWKFAEEVQQNLPEMAYVPYIAQTADAILEGALDCAEAAGRGDQEGLKQLLDCIVLELQVNNQMGHARAEEGSEHYFAYAAENLTGSGWPHADLLGPGILLMMTLQGQETQRVRRALHRTCIPLQRISTPVIRKTLLDLPAYCRQQNLPYGIAHELTAERIERLDFARILY